tara:strand:- start:12325 stop:15204 length:2880 start_codon:yes stop_codon:yes gene_type:complete
MRTRKKPSKRSLVKKLQNGGTGDPKKPVVTQSAAGFPLFKEDGKLTATPVSSFYTKTNQQGYYEGVPILLPEAEIVADSDDALGSVDKVVEELGGGIFGDYAALPSEEREKFEDGVRDAIGEGGKIALIATSPLLAIAAAPMLASGLQGYSAVSQLPLVTLEGQTAVTVGGGLDALGVGLSAKYLPQHIKDFKENPSLGNAAFIGLDFMGFMPAGNAALQSYRQSLRAGTSTPRTPITLASGESATTRAALEGSRVQQASLSMNNVIKNEIAKIDKMTISPAEKQKAIDETLEFYNNYLSNPAALEKIVEQKEFLEAVRQARTGDISALLGDIEVPMAPFESAGERSVAAVRYMQNPPFFSKFNVLGERLDPDMNLVRNMRVVEGVDGAPEARVDFFSNTPSGRRLSAEALLENFRTGSQSAKNVILRTVEDMKRVVGAEARGAVMAPPNITGRTEMVGGVPLPPEISGPYGLDLSRAQINMLQTLSPEQFLSTLVHETNHNMLLPFLDQLADAQIIEMHTIVSTASTPTIVGGRQVAATTTATGFRSADQINDNVMNFLTKYSNDSRIKDAGVNDNGIVAYLEDIAKPQEVQARLFEIKKQFANIASKQGQKFEDWMYNFTPETARQGFEAWKASKSRGAVGLGEVEADMFLDLMVGNNQQQKLQTLASVLNKTFTNTALIGGTAAVATQADITGTTTQGPGLKRGGFVSKKKKRKGFRSKKSYRYGQNGTKTPKGEYVDPTPFMQPEMSKFIRGGANAAQFSDDYNEILKGLVQLRDSAENGEGSKASKESISAKDIAQLADEKAGPDAKYSFYDLMGSTYWIESRNRNIEQDAPQLNKRSRANMEGQLEPGAIKAANNYANAIAKAIGKDWEGLTKSEIENPLTIPKEKRDVLSFAYMYGPEGTPTSQYLRGEVPFGEFWSKHWNRTGSPTRAAEAQRRLDATYPGTESIFPEYMD